MAELVLEVEERNEFGKNVNRRLRAQGLIPCVVYGRGIETWKVAVSPKEVMKIFESDSGRNTIFSVKVGSESRNVVIKDFQLDPIKGNLLHVDFQRIDMDQKMSFQVPVETVGTSTGVKNHGGILDMVMREIEIECLPKDVPDHLQIDITDLDVGDSYRVSSISVDPNKFTILSDPDNVVLTIVSPRVEEVEEIALEEEGIGEVPTHAELARSAEEGEED